MSQTNRQMRGKLGENLAHKFLTSRGYTLLVKNWTCESGEIDLVMYENDTLVFVEVKFVSNSSFVSAYEQLTEEKFNHLKRSIGIYLKDRKKITGNKSKWRLDVVCITQNKRSNAKNKYHVEHFNDVFKELVYH